MLTTVAAAGKLAYTVEKTRLRQSAMPHPARRMNCFICSKRLSLRFTTVPFSLPIHLA